MYSTFSPYSFTVRRARSKKPGCHRRPFSLRSAFIRSVEPTLIASITREIVSKGSADLLSKVRGTLHRLRNIIIHHGQGKGVRRGGPGRGPVPAAHGHDTRTHHFQDTVGTKHFQHPIDLVFGAGDFDG